MQVARLTQPHGYSSFAVCYTGMTEDMMSTPEVWTNFLAQAKSYPPAFQQEAKPQPAPSFWKENERKAYQL